MTMGSDVRTDNCDAPHDLLRQLIGDLRGAVVEQEHIFEGL